MTITTTKFQRAIQYMADVEKIIDYMILIDKEVGDIWKWPDANSCFLYAITESAEYIEAHLLKSRPNDSRNNKTIDDFDSATELFDTFMMVLRGVMRSGVYPKLEEAKATILAAIDRFVEKNISDFGKPTNDLDSFSNNPHILTFKICGMLVGGYTVPSNENSAAYYVMKAIYLSQEFESVPFIEIAMKKLEKIYNKNLAKKEAQKSDGQ